MKKKEAMNPKPQRDSHPLSLSLSPRFSVVFSIRTTPSRQAGKNNKKQNRGASAGQKKLVAYPPLK
jgi:hypothetical protein